MPGAGYCAAVTLEMAAGLVAMAARVSRAEWGEARGAAAQATTLRERIAPLAERNVDAYREAVALLGGEEAGGGDESLRDALARAAGVPLEIAEVAVDVAALAAVVAERGDQALRADAVSAALLAEAAARAAATLVEVNLGTTSVRRAGRPRARPRRAPRRPPPSGPAARSTSVRERDSRSREDPPPLGRLVVVGHDDSDGLEGKKWVTGARPPPRARTSRGAGETAGPSSIFGRMRCSERRFSTAREDPRQVARQVVVIASTTLDLGGV